MADDTASTKYMQDRIAALEAEKAQLNAALTQQRRETRAIREALGVKSLPEARAALEALMAEHAEATEALGELAEGYEALEAEHATLAEAANTGPEEWRQKYESLNQEVRGRDHRAAFGKLAAAEGFPEDRHDALYKLLGLEVPAEGDLAPELFADAIGQAKDAYSWMLGAPTPEAGGNPAAGAAPDKGAAPTQAPRAPLSEGLPGGRGARDASPAKVRVRRADLNDPTLAYTAQQHIKAAGPDGYELVD